MIDVYEMVELDQRITELDIFDAEREEPYVRCDYCGDVFERADLAVVDDSGAVCHCCMAQEQHEHFMTHRRYG